MGPFHQRRGPPAGPPGCYGAVAPPPTGIRPPQRGTPPQCRLRRFSAVTRLSAYQGFWLGLEDRANSAAGYCLDARCEDRVASELKADLPGKRVEQPGAAGFEHTKESVSPVPVRGPARGLGRG